MTVSLVTIVALITVVEGTLFSSLGGLGVLEAEAVQLATLAGDLLLNALGWGAFLGQEGPGITLDFFLGGMSSSAMRSEKGAVSRMHSGLVRGAQDFKEGGTAQSWGKKTLARLPGVGDNLADTLGLLDACGVHVPCANAWSAAYPDLRRGSVETRDESSRCTVGKAWWGKGCDSLP